MSLAQIEAHLREYAPTPHESAASAHSRAAVRVTTARDDLEAAERELRRTARRLAALEEAEAARDRDSGRAARRELDRLLALFANATQATFSGGGCRELVKESLQRVTDSGDHAYHAALERMGEKP